MNDLDEASLQLYSSADGGTTWQARGGVRDADANTVTLTGISAFSRWTLGAGAGSCCVGRVGDANGSGQDEPTIGDISIMIDAKFISGTCVGKITCFAEADINQSGLDNPTCDAITIGDISYLIDYLFVTGSSIGLLNCR